MAKKILSLILCALMISAASLPVKGASSRHAFASEQTKTDSDKSNTQNDPKAAKNTPTTASDIASDVCQVACVGAYGIFMWKYLNSPNSGKNSIPIILEKNIINIKDDIWTPNPNTPPLRVIDWRDNQSLLTSSILKFYYDPNFSGIWETFPTDEAEKLLHTKELNNEQRSALDLVIDLHKILIALRGEMNDPDFQKPWYVKLNPKSEQAFGDKLSRFAPQNFKQSEINKYTYTSTIQKALKTVINLFKQNTDSPELSNWARLNESNLSTPPQNTHIMRDGNHFYIELADTDDNILELGKGIYPNNSISVKAAASTESTGVGVSDVSVIERDDDSSEKLASATDSSPKSVIVKDEDEDEGEEGNAGTGGASTEVSVIEEDDKKASKPSSATIPQTTPVTMLGTSVPLAQSYRPGTGSNPTIPQQISSPTVPESDESPAAPTKQPTIWNLYGLFS